MRTIRYNSTGAHLVRKTGGFTLVEVIVASVLVATSLSGVWGLLHWLVYSTYLSGRQISAGYAAGEKMEELLSSPSSSGCDMFDGFTRTWSVTPMPDNQQKISVDVQWVDIRTRSHSIAMQSTAINAVTSYTGVAFSDLFVGASP